MTFWQNVGAMVSRNRYAGMLCVIVFCMVAALELRFPYFFLQDDNRVQHLPFYVHNLRALLAGEFPLYNFHQYLGLPVGIQNAALYPINYIGLLVSRLFLGHYLGAIDCIAGIHLIIAALGVFRLLRFFDLEEPGCLFGAIAYTFSGYVITFGSSWIQTLDCAAYLPWLLLYGLQLAGRGGHANFLILVGLRVVTLLVGYPQLYLYIAAFEAMTVGALLFTARFSGQGSDAAGEGCRQQLLANMLRYLFSHAAAIGIAMPLLLPAYYQASVSLTRKKVLDWSSYIAGSYDLKLWLNGLVAPFNEAGIATWNELHFISHIGYLTLLCLFVALWTLRRSPWRNEIVIFAGLAFLALLWSGDTVVTRLVYQLPVFNKFKHPFKLALFTSFYLTVIASFGFDLVWRKLKTTMRAGRAALRILLPLLFALHILNFIGIHTFPRQHSFAQMLDPVPFDEPLKEELSQGRIVSVAQKDINDNALGKAMGVTVPLLGYDYATLWGLYHLGGHDSLVPEENFKAAFQLSYESTLKVPPGAVLDDRLKAMLAYFRLWGVRWYVVDKAVPVGDPGGLQLFHEDPARKIYFDPAGLPFAFWTDAAAAPGIRHEFRTNSIVLHTERPSAGTALVNILWHPFFSAEVDGKKAAIARTNGRQLLVEVPAGNHVVTVTYSDPYFRAGLFISLVTIAAVLGYGWTSRRAEFRISRQLDGGC